MRPVALTEAGLTHYRVLCRRQRRTDLVNRAGRRQGRSMITGRRIPGNCGCSPVAEFGKGAARPIFRGIGLDELTFRRGVAGFFARGHHPVPDGAQVLTRLAGGEPATYLDRVSTAGTILVQAGSDLLGYCGA
jgi:hypothetical protein